MTNFSRSFFVFIATILSTTVSMAAKDDGFPIFQKLQSKSTALFECGFKVMSEEGSGTYKGRFRLSAVGESHLVLQKGVQTPIECQYKLQTLDLGTDSVDGKTRLVAINQYNCNELRPILVLNIGWQVDPKKPKASDAEIVLLQHDGPTACHILRFQKNELQILSKKLHQNRSKK